MCEYALVVLLALRLVPPYAFVALCSNDDASRDLSPRLPLAECCEALFRQKEHRPFWDPLCGNPVGWAFCRGKPDKHWRITIPRVV